MTNFGLAELAAAGRTVAAAMLPTPQICWPLLSEAVGAEVWVKHENHTPIGAFKVRGGLVHLDRLAREPVPPAGVVSATRGNHGQSLAFAARTTGLQAVVVVPEGNNPEKNAAMRALGAEVVVSGSDFQESRGVAAELAGSRGLRMVPPFHPDLVLGVATYALELLTAVADLDSVYVPVGMGSGIAGLIAVRDLLGLRTEIVGVVAAGADAYARSLAAGRIVSTERALTFVDGVACREPDPAACAVIAKGAARVVTVPDAETAEAMRLMLRATHNLPEPAGAIALAALSAERDQQRGRRVAVVLTGGNADAGTLATVLAGGTPAA
ncbi:MAG: threonine dehydratase [Pseudonocardiales bacterium]|nr:MAG: threonine dehydratase [Pseudonocardiales bacterium]